MPHIFLEFSMLRHVLLTTVALAVAAPAFAQGVPANSPFSVESPEQAADRAKQAQRNKEMLAAEKRRIVAARKAAAEKRRAAAEEARRLEEERQQEFSQPEPVEPVTPSAAPEAPISGAAPVEPIHGGAAPVAPVAAPEAPIAPDVAPTAPIAPIAPEASSPALEPIAPAEVPASEEE